MNYSISELSKITGKSRAAIYNLAKKLGRIPTIEEINNQKVGRPTKYKELKEGVNNMGNLNKIKFNDKVFAFLYEKLDKDTDKLYEILDTAIYYADQNVSSQAVRLGRMFQFQEKVVLASIKVAEIIKEIWGDVDFEGLRETEYCELI